MVFEEKNMLSCDKIFVEGGSLLNPIWKFENSSLKRRGYSAIEGNGLYKGL